MPELVVGQNYTRSQVAAIINMPENRQAGSWLTGYDQWENAIYVFAGVGTAGRTGHDYPNRWDGARLIWYGKGTTRLGQPMIDRIVSNEVPVHIFWRGRDKAPFTYAGIGTAVEVTDTEPVNVLWDFEGNGAGARVDIAAAATQAFRRGPPPVVGEIRMERLDGPTDVYVLRLDGPVEAIMDVPAGHVVIKIGMSRNVPARVAQLNVGFPAKSRIQWREDRRRTYPSREAAFEAEGAHLERIRLNGWWLNGEFAAAPAQLLDELLD